MAWNHVDVSEATRKTERGRHVQLEPADVFPSLSQQRQTAKPQHLTTKSAWPENEGCHLRSRISDHSSSRQQAGEHTPMGPYIRRQPLTMKMLQPLPATNPTRSFSGVVDDHYRSGDKMLDHSTRKSCGGGRQSFEKDGISHTNLRYLAPRWCPTFDAVKWLP